MQVERDYLLEETTRWFDRIEDVVECEADYPRQQFYLVPWSWRWYAQLRRPLPPSKDSAPGAAARMHRAFRLVGVDLLLNGAVRTLAARLRWWTGIRLLYRRMFPLVARSGMHVVDHSTRLLTMRHDLYRHVEMELFVPRHHLVRAAAFVAWVLRWCGGEPTPLPYSLAQDDFGCDVLEVVQALKGTYVHDYLVTFRKVLADDTLISMTSGDRSEAWYAISLVTYQRDHLPFLGMAAFLAASMASVYGARPHWGKICPLSTAAVERLYPDLPRFRSVCAAIDREQVFVNDFARRVLGF